MKSYVKLYGPDYFEALEKLEKLTENEAVITGERERLVIEPASMITPIEKQPYEVHKLICPDWTIGFDWVGEPKLGDVQALIARIDNVLKDTRARYTITTISDILAPPAPEENVKLPSDITENYAITYLKFFGPPLLASFEIIPKIIERWPEISSGAPLARESGPQLGIFDFALVWRQLPTPGQLQELLKELDKELSKANLMYNHMTKSYSSK